MSAEARNSDDLGRYRIVGLAPRDYTVQVDLELQNRNIGMTIDGYGTSMMYLPVARISFFSGATTRQRDATSFKLAAGDERSWGRHHHPARKVAHLERRTSTAHDGHLPTMQRELT